MNINAVVIDDEPLARSRILKLLREYPEVQVVGQGKYGAEAIRLVNHVKPQLIFLDIQMPDMNGFEVLSKIDRAHQPFVIFATAYDQYALKAFDVHAIDYLLKPFDKERFREALERAKKQLQLQKSSELGRKLDQLLQDYHQEPSALPRELTIRENGRNYSILLNEVLWFKACGNYVSITLAKKRFLYRSTMQDISALVDPKKFLRIHRSYLINYLHVEQVHYHHNNQYLFKFDDQTSLLSGRSYKSKIMNFLSESTSP